MRFRFPVLGSLCLLSVSGCVPATPAATSTPPASTSTSALDPDQITQVSVINALMLGQYDGQMGIPEMLRYGNFGVGTLDHLDGELIVLDGKAYQVRGDGQVLEVGPDRSTPFVVVTSFDQDGAFPCPPVGSLTDLEAHLNESLAQKNNFVAIRVEARFRSLTLRSVHRQEPPYKPLAEVAKSQSVWTHENLSGTLVGIRSPAWVDGLNVPGYHWHFLSEDHKIGGHLLDCRVRDGRVRYDICGDWLLKLSESKEFNTTDLGRDLSRDLKRVESSRGQEDEVDAKK
ncbi:acetolactate decarboxylase [Singulisphaera acidiphila]|uniref:Alpha-acetolactate decarboxylase n=1 Tax=Singulisphaera acidiphila (strain ATCC BAA-1392 / DSM 18658 / VKM B-2454 / MOB10) TaxID=886293 RepID=L0DJ08_SINAD|nr:acetolactate decarboxylase [Singulisphaera acidiphila]AGA29252.1 alpha-acetolactate decarboxylase [Singulisphaera acidiphila DSM 18658]